jgi:hypothetical protein
MKDELQALLKTAEHFDDFAKEFSSLKLEQRLDFLSDEYCIVFRKIFESHVIEKVSAIIELLPSKDFSQDEIASLEKIILCTRDLYRSNQEKAKEIFGLLLMIAPEQLFYKNEIVMLCPYISVRHFKPFIDKISTFILPRIFFNISQGKNEQVHALNLVLKNQGSEAFHYLLKKFPDEMRQDLTNELCKFLGGSAVYEKMIRFSGDHITMIIELITNSITEAKRKSLIIEHFERMPHEAIISLLSSFPLQMRKALILNRLTDFNQTIILERLAEQVKSNVLHYIEIIGLFPEPNDRFMLFAQSVRYRSNISYSNDPTLNSFASGLSNLAGKIPLVGTHAKAAVQSFQIEQDISELILSRILRSNPELYKALAGMFSGLTPHQYTTLLKEADSTGLNLLFHTVANCPKNDVFEILGASAYHTQDSEKLLSFTEGKLDALRGLLKNNSEGAGRVGLMAFLNIYNYLSIRSMEPGKMIYQQSKNEISILLATLKENQYTQSPRDIYNKHCREYPLRQAKAVKLASSAIQFGTNRHYDARNLLGTLSDREMREGLDYFNEFLLARREVYGFITLDIESLLIALRRYVGKDDNPRLLEITSRSNLSEIIDLKKQYTGRRPDQVLPLLDIIIMRRVKFEDAGFSEEYDKSLLKILDCHDTRRSLLSIH